MKPVKICVLLLLISIGMEVVAQNSGGTQAPQIIMPKPPRRVGNPALRYEVDAKRIGSNMNSDDALPRSREFIRIDSTYYVGWLYEGAYKYNHAADFVGYKNAVTPLERALHLIERDYAPELRTRTHNVYEYVQIYAKQIDFSIITNLLTQCYLNTDDPEKCYALQRRYLKWNFQRDFFDPYNYLMWITHRNRFYTREKYAFLTDSLAGNEALANRYLDSAIRRLQRNAQFNIGVFTPGYDHQDYNAVYHYKSLINAYALNIDSAEHYFDLLRSSAVFPHNNYATFKVIQGDFRAGEAEYKLAQYQDPGDKRLQEWAYYTSILDIYKANPKRGELQMKEMIQAAGSTPGFGWYNIALARSLYYDGQTEESERYTDRAAGFKELHIGTTLGQTHYDFSTQLLKLMNAGARFERQRFEHRNWWYNPGTIGAMIRLSAERYMQAFVIINQFAQNPERDQVIYRLFSTESTISWDEVYNLVQHFSTRFFVDRFTRAAATDPRPVVRKYFKLMIARLHIKEGEYKEAEPLLNEVLRDQNIDNDYEKLFLARTYEALARCADGLGRPAQRDEWLAKLYGIYPQLVPFSGMKMPMQLQVTGNPDPAVVARLRDCSIRFDDPAATNRAQLSFERKDKAWTVYYAVIDGKGNYVVPRQSYSYSDAAVAGVSLAYRLFGVGGAAPKDEEEDI